jgi:hypothetical protein
MQQWATATMAQTPAASDEREIVVAATFARGTSTVSAIRRLAVHGFGVHGLMLARSLFEDALTATWVQVTAPEDIIHRYDRHHALSRELAAAATGREPSADEVEAALTEEDRRLFGRHAERSWTGQSAQEQLRAITRSWQGSPRHAKRLEGLWLYHRLFQRLNSTLLHNSPQGMEPFYEWHEGEPFTLKMAKTDERAFDALVNALITYGFLVTATLDMLAPARREEFDALRGSLLAEVDAAVADRSDD